jgi:hypothetical protein
MSGLDNPAVEQITYKFKFNDKPDKEFVINIETKSFGLIRCSANPPADWTRLERFACPNCPIADSEFEYCPIAVNLMDIIEFFSEIPSYEKTNIEVHTSKRTYCKDTSVQQGVSAIIGVVMSTSGCPVLSKLRPMARFHLPFADLDETQMRIFSFYLLAQYLKMRKDGDADWKMDELGELYSRIRDINVNIANRIANLEKEDASINAVVVLNNFAHSVSLSIDDNLEEIEPYLTEFIDNLNKY